MRILLVTGSLPPMRCGVGDYSLNLAKALIAEPELHVGILTSTLAKDAEQIARIEVFPVIKKWSFLEILKIIKNIRNWSPDIVHIQYPTQGYGNSFLPWILPLIAFLMGKKVVQTWHEGYSRRTAPKLFLKSIVPSGLVFVRPQYEENLHPQLRWALRGKRTEFIPNASAIPRIDPGEYEKNGIRGNYLKRQNRLIVFFGFVYPHKGVELLFEIANSEEDQIVIAGEVDESGKYCQEILRRASTAEWLGKVTITGFLHSADIAILLTVADAVILPFRSGGGEWNTSIHGAVLNGTLVITTSLTKSGYDEKCNVYYAKVDDIQEMKSALANYAGIKRKYCSDIDQDEWIGIAKRHHLLYENMLTK